MNSTSIFITFASILGIIISLELPSTKGPYNIFRNTWELAANIYLCAYIFFSLWFFSFSLDLPHISTTSANSSLKRMDARHLVTIEGLSILYLKSSGDFSDISWINKIYSIIQSCSEQSDFPKKAKLLAEMSSLLRQMLLPKVDFMATETDFSSSSES